MILTGLGGIVLVEIYAAVMQREFQDTDNKIGKGFTILGIYLFAVIYCKPACEMVETTTDINRWYAQQHNLVVRSRGSAHFSAQ